MPNIREYRSPARELNPSQIGVSAAAAAGRQLGSAYREGASAIAQGASDEAQAFKGITRTIEEGSTIAQKFNDHRQISQGGPELSNLILAKEKEWNELIKNPGFDANDPTVAKRFLDENLEPALQKFNEGFWSQGARDWAEQRTTQFRTHMLNRTIGDMATLAGAAVVVNHRQMVNNLSNTVRSDPTGIDFAIGTLKSSTDALIETSHNLTGAAAAKVRAELAQKGTEEIVKAAAVGHIEATGQVPKWATDPKYSPFLDGGDLKRLEGFANAQQRANVLTQKQLQEHYKRQQSEAANEALSKNFSGNVTFDVNGKALVGPDYFRNLMEIEKQFPGAATERTKAMINFGQAQQREKREVILTDRATQSTLYDGLFKTEDPTTDVDILKAAAEKKLDAHATSTLMALHKALEEAPLKGPIYNDTMRAVKGIYGDSEKGHESYAKFLQTFIPEYLKQRRAGTLPPNALDLRDETSLISKSVAPWRLSAEEKLMYRLTKNLGGPEALEGVNFGDLLRGGGAKGSETKPLAPERPASLAGKDVQYNIFTKQWRDKGSGALYDRDGKLATQVPTAEGAATLPRITSKEEADKLPAGAEYVGPGGIRARKK